MIDNFEYIIGITSGQIINVQTKDLYELTKSNTVFWDSEMGEFCYSDNSYNTINKFINKLKMGDLVRIINTSKVGYLVDIVEDYQGEEINGMEISHLFNFGDDIYMVEFPNNKKGVYNEYEVEKYLLEDSFFV